MATAYAIIDRILGRIEEFLISVMLGIATLAVFSQVVARYVFHSGINWVPELVEYMFLWTVMLGASYGVRYGVHLGVDILAKKLPTKVRRLVSLLSVAISVAFTGGMAYLSCFYVFNTYKYDLISVDLGIPIWIPNLALPVGFLLITCRFLEVGWLIYQGEMATVTKGSDPGHFQEVVD